jgi:hypothetical protein
MDGKLMKRQRNKRGREAPGFDTTGYRLVLPDTVRRAGSRLECET